MSFRMLSMWVALAGILLGFPAAAQPDGRAGLPDTPAGMRLAAWLEAVNGPGDPGTDQAFYDTHFAPGLRDVFSAEAFHQMQEGIRQKNPGLRLHSVLGSRPDRLEVLCRGGRDQWLEIMLNVAPEGDHRIVGFRIDDDADPPCYDMDIPVPNIAVGYTEERFDDPGEHEDHAPWMDAAGELRENTYLHSIKGGPAGGGFSTVEDLVRFGQALTDGTLIRPETLELLTTAKSEPQSRGGEASGYGYGFRIWTTEDGVRRFGHGGGFPGINGELLIYPGSGVIMAALANVDRGAEPILRHAGRLLPRGE